MPLSTAVHERYFTVATRDPRSIPSYLYSHTEIVRQVEAEGRTHFLLRTTADNDGRVSYLVNYQRDRLGSGLHGVSHVSLTEAHAVQEHIHTLGVNLAPVQQVQPVRVHVSVDVEVDPQIWASTYGLAYDTVGLDGAALRNDIETHVKEIVQEAAREAIARIAAGAEVK